MLWQYQDFISNRKEKLVNMLISEIIFLKSKIEKSQGINEVKELQIGLDKLEFILNRLKKNRLDLPKSDFDKTIMLIYRIFKDIAVNLEEKIKV
jgi:hypothetical protein